MSHATAEILLSLMKSKTLTLATAESCTGGALAGSLTLVPGASQVFLGGLVAYSNQMKTELLKVPETLIETYGAVSQETARAMWEGTLSLIPSDYAVVTTGISGPGGGSQDKPVGTVWIAVGKRGEEPEIWNLKAEGSRSEIIKASKEAALQRLIELVKKN